MTNKEFLKIIDGMANALNHGAFRICYALDDIGNPKGSEDMLQFIRETYYASGLYLNPYWLGRDTTTDERITILCLLEHSQTHEIHGYKDYLSWED